ncbi:MAG: hypothetical protein WC521_02525 [Bdellovibrionales bacterium]|jgi:hypothetical protein
MMENQNYIPFKWGDTKIKTESLIDKIERSPRVVRTPKDKSYLGLCTLPLFATVRCLQDGLKVFEGEASREEKIAANKAIQFSIIEISRHGYEDYAAGVLKAWTTQEVFQLDPSHPKDIEHYYIGRSGMSPAAAAP